MEYKPQQESHNNKDTYVTLAIILFIIVVFTVLVIVLPKNPGPQNQPVPRVTSAAPNQTVTVALTDKGFVPATITINPGDTVTFLNNSSGRMWVASDKLFNEKTDVGRGESYSYTFTKSGYFKINNTVNSVFGTVIVTGTQN